MRLTVLGGSAAGSNTGQGCSGYLIESTAAAVVLDLGPGTLQELRKHTNYRTLTGIVISHMHVDHMADLLALRFALAYNPIPPPGPVRLLVPPGGRAVLDTLAAVFASGLDGTRFFSSVFEIEEYNPAAGVSLSSLKISFLPTVHYIPCWAIRIAAPGSGSGDLTYTADSGPAAPLMSFASGSSVLIAEATHLVPPTHHDGPRGHLTAEEAGVLASASGVDTLVLTHLWEEVGFERYRTSASSQYTGRVEIARPGLYVEW